MPAPRTLTPPPISLPSDVNLFLESIENLDQWEVLVTWIDGEAPEFAPGVSQDQNHIIDTNIPASGKAFYRYRVELK